MRLPGAGEPGAARFVPTVDIGRQHTPATGLPPTTHGGELSRVGGRRYHPVDHENLAARPVRRLRAAPAAYGLYHRTDAYRHGNRLFYRDGRPNRAGRVFGDFWTLVGGLGLTPSYLVALETTGYRTGRSRSIPVVIGEFEGERYIVSMRDERSPWVRNVRAAEGRAIIRHGRRREIRLVEIPPAERAPLIKAYPRRGVGARPHIPVDHSAPVEAFEPIAADYPVFRILE